MEASPVEGQSQQEKDKKRRKGRAEKTKTTRSLRMPKQKCVMLAERKACCHVPNAFMSRLGLIWPISSMEIPRVSKKKCFLSSSGLLEGPEKVSHPESNSKRTRFLEATYFFTNQSRICEDDH